MVLFIENVCYLEREGALNHSVLNREVCAQSHVIAPISHGAAMRAMAARVMRVSRVYMDALDCKSMRSIVVRSILVHTLDHTNRDSLLLFHLLLHFDGKDLQQKKTLKQAKILENNKAKGLTNIN